MVKCQVDKMPNWPNDVAVSHFEITVQSALAYFSVASKTKV
jgi:hypothetical protein